METIQEILAKSPYLQGRSAKEALETFSHIELTEEETDEAILHAKQKKAERINQAERERKAEENRKHLISKQWSVEQTAGFMQYRAMQLFNGRMRIDESNKAVYDLLCHYFSASETFHPLAFNMGVVAPGLHKGILLAGNFGVGKTWLMKLFSRNQRQVYNIVNAKDIANEFETEGQEGMDYYVKKHKNAINDASCFFQPYSGLCIDDLGTEDIKIHYGNKKNVIGDILEQRYAAGNCGEFLHATTNLTAEQMKDFYGGRIVSRLRETFNLIELNGEDKRK
jgi:DNA replication protein DnaC